MLAESGVSGAGEGRWNRMRRGSEGQEGPQCWD